MKLRRKLLAAGFAFGATALTLTTSTFAWYTSNTEATVNNMHGMTSATADTNSFYVAAATTYDSNYKGSVFTEYSSKVTPTVVADTSTGAPVHQLNPVTYVGKVTSKGEGSAYVTGTDDVNFIPFFDTIYDSEKDTADPKDSEEKPNVVRYGAYNPNNVFEYVLRFRMANNATAAKPLYFSQFSLVPSKITGYNPQVALAKGTGTGITASGEYFADLAKAMKLTVKAQNIVASEAAGARDGYIETEDAPTITTYDLTSFAKNEDVHIEANGANAVGYYNTVTKSNISGTATSGTKIKKLATAADTDAISFASIPTTGYVEVTFTFWLDGWDEYCYDVMQQQAFDFSFAATTDKVKSVIAEDKA